MSDHAVLPYGTIQESDDVVVYHIAKTETNLIEYEQLDELKREDPSFFHCQHYIVDEESIRIFYKKETAFHKLSNYRDGGSQEIKRNIANHILKSENLLGTQFTTFIHPD